MQYRPKRQRARRTLLLGFALVLPLLACKNFDWTGGRNKLPTETFALPSVGLSAVTFAPVQGLYTSAQNVVISHEVAGATICYTTNGTAPDCDLVTASCTTGSTYSVAVNIASNLTLKAVACKPGYTKSLPTSGSFIIDTTPTAAASAFVASPGDGAILLSWANPADADFNRIVIVRKVGSAPTNSADGIVAYSGNALSFSDTGLGNGTLYYYAAYAYDIAGNESAVVTANAQPLGGLVNAPAFTPPAGIFNATQMVTPASSTPGAIVCYTTNGSAPACDATPTCTNGTLATGAVSISTTQTLRAIACKNGSSDSAITSGLYTIDTTPPLVSGLQPATGTEINSTQVSYTLSETCATASMVWQQAGGTSDAASPHTSTLTTSEMQAGNYSAITLVNNPILVQGAIYNISLSCTDAAGNTSATVQNTSILFDILPTGNASSFVAIAGNTKNTLAWTNPVDADLAGVRIVRKTGSYPAGINDGTVIFTGLATSFVDGSLTNGTAYYYRAFAFDSTGNYAPGVTATATPFSPCGGGNCRIFVTAVTYDGNLGGPAGADAKCNADAAKPNASTYKALLASPGVRQGCTAANCTGASGVEQSLDWPIFPSRSYVRADGSTAIGSSNTNALFSVPLTVAVSASASQVWTGLNVDWTSGTDHCLSWTDGTSANSGLRGNANSPTAASWSNTANPCQTARAIYCVEQ